MMRDVLWSVWYRLIGRPVPALPLGVPIEADVWNDDDEWVRYEVVILERLDDGTVLFSAPDDPDGAIGLNPGERLTVHWDNGGWFEITL